MEHMLVTRGHRPPFHWHEVADVHRGLELSMQTFVILGRPGHKIGKSAIKDLPSHPETILVSDHVSRPAGTALAAQGWSIFTVPEILINPLSLMNIPTIRRIRPEQGCKQWPSIKVDDRVAKYMGLKVGECIATNEHQRYVVVQ